MRGRGGYALIYSITEIEVSLEDPEISRLSSRPTNRPNGKIGGNHFSLRTYNSQPTLISFTKIDEQNVFYSCQKDMSVDFLN